MIRANRRYGPDMAAMIGPTPETVILLATLHSCRSNVRPAPSGAGLSESESSLENRPPPRACSGQGAQQLHAGLDGLVRGGEAQAEVRLLLAEDAARDDEAAVLDGLSQRRRRPAGGGDEGVVDADFEEVDEENKDKG